VTDDDLIAFELAIEGRGWLVRRLIAAWLALATLPGKALIWFGTVTRTWLVVAMGGDLHDLALRAPLLALGVPSTARVRRRARIAILTARLDTLNAEMADVLRCQTVDVEAGRILARAQPLTDELERLIREERP
jgi:hypothetical protein